MSVLLRSPSERKPGAHGEGFAGSTEGCTRLSYGCVGAGERLREGIGSVASRSAWAEGRDSPPHGSALEPKSRWSTFEVSTFQAERLWHIVE